MTTPTAGTTRRSVSRTTMSGLNPDRHQRQLREDAIDAMFARAREEAIDCTREDVGEAYMWMQTIVERCREIDYDFVYPARREMTGLEYEIINAVMEHGATADEGSAHRKLELALLNPACEVSILHDIHEVGSRDYCNFRVALLVVR